MGVQSTFVYIYAGLRDDDLGKTLCSFNQIISVEKSRRCNDDQQISVTHFSENDRLHPESSKQNYYIISL